MTYIPGVEKTRADELSWLEYPASQAIADLTKHGSGLDKEEMEVFFKEERSEERLCMGVSKQ